MMGFTYPKKVLECMGGVRWPLMTLPENCPRGGDSTVWWDFKIAPKRTRSATVLAFRMEELFLGAGHPRLIFAGNPKDEIMRAYRREDYITD